MLQDIAILTGATVISEEIGLKLETADVEMLGSARKIVVTKDETTIVEGSGSEDDIKAASTRSRPRLRTPTRTTTVKAAGASGQAVRGVAVIKVGARPKSS